jgi:hypothetical protein
MGDQIPRAARAASSHLAPGEHILGAHRCRPRVFAAGSGLGGLIGAVLASRGRKDDRTQADASGHPYLAKLCDLVPTNERLLVVLGKRFLGAIEPEELAGAEVVEKTLLSPWRIRIDMANGSSITMETTKKPDLLAERINQLARPDHRVPTERP